MRAHSVKTLSCNILTARERETSTPFFTAISKTMTTIPIQIRPAVPADLSAIAALAQRSILEGCRPTYDAIQRRVWAARLSSVAHWQHIYDIQYMVVAQCVDNLVGMAALEGVEHVDYLYVDPMAFRQGVATELYQTLVQRAQQQGAMRLYSEVSHQARPFFERMGWQVDHVRTVRIDEVELTNNAMSLVLT